MANEIAGERAQCPCQREGWIVNRSNPLQRGNWFEIAHEDGHHHFVTVVQMDDACFRFEMIDEGDCR